MDIDLKFVDSISASATVRLDLMAAPWAVQRSTEFGMPELRRAVAATLLTDGDRYPASAYGNRTIQLVAKVQAASGDATASALQALYRELDRASNVLRYRPVGATAPVFFRTFRCGPADVVWDPLDKSVTALIPAEPFALGLKETLGPYTVFNDPATPGGDLNSNPYFETDGILNSNPYFETTVSPWTAAMGGTVARSTTQSHEGAASLLFTPDGVTATGEVRSENVAGVVAGQAYVASAWVRCAVARSVNINIVWRDAGGAFLSSAGAVSTSVAAGTWAPVSLTATAPGSAAQAQISLSMGGTPLASHLLWVDEARLQPAAPANWSALGGAVVRSTTQAHDGTASLLFTPDGVSASVEARAENVPATAGRSYRASAWVRCAGARTVNVGVIWRNAGGAQVASSLVPVSVAAGVWTFVEGSHVCPSGATQAQLVVTMGGTPPASHTLHVDEARLRLEGAGNAMFADLTGVKGDVETPLRITVGASSDLDTGDMSVFALRRRGTPSQMAVVLQAEAMTQGSDTTVQAAASDISGTGTSTWSRTAFSGGGTAVRLSSAVWPLADNPDVRGRYRVYARVRTTNAFDVVYVQLRWGLSLISAGNAEVSVGWDGSAGNSGWKLVNLGLISFPSGGDPGSDGLTGAPLNARGQKLEVSARRPTGSGSLDWDYLLFVPADDRLGVIRWGDLDTQGSFVIDGTTETIYGITTQGVVYGGGTPPVPTAWPVASPGVTNRLFWLRSAGPYVTDLTTASTGLTVEYMPRYLYARPPSS